ncbi:MAG: kynureninase [Lysobacterales bacterium]|jgi:kynureninase
MRSAAETARELDAGDPLRGFRDRFWIPPRQDGGEQTYLCGHSLGLQPRDAESALQRELLAWRERAVGGHFEGNPPWTAYAGLLGEALAPVLGAHAAEIAVMNTLTVNLHLMLASFFRPTGRRRKILIEAHAFPSDRYALVSQLRFHGLDPNECLVELEPDPGSRLLEESRIESWLAANGEDIALVLWPGVQYASGQAFDLGRIAAAGRAAGARVGFDLAHSAGNLPLALHDSGCDFAVWCHYKYLNGGPGAIAGCFVHDRHGDGSGLPRLEGWWGNAPETRFRMAHEFQPAPGASAWQISTPPLLAMAPLRAALELFTEAGMKALRTKSLTLTGYLARRVQEALEETLEIITPTDPDRRGCQLSLRVRAGREPGKRLFRFLQENGIVADWREPDIIRVAPVPLYNRFQDCEQLVQTVCEWKSGTG